MDNNNRLILEIWPEVPEVFRPRELPHDGRFTAADVEVLKSRGYEPVDVRFLSGQHAVEAYLAGGRLGTVELSKTQLETLELEAKVFGLTQAGRRHSGPPKPKVSDTERDAIFTFFNARRNYGASLPDPASIPKPRLKGRKKYEKDKKQRPLTERQAMLKQRGEEYRARKAVLSAGAGSSDGQDTAGESEPSVREWFDLVPKNKTAGT